MIRFLQKISAREIQVFAGGTLAVEGFRALIALPYYLAGPINLIRIGTLIVTGLALLIGISILTERPRAVFYASLYLCLTVLGACLAMPIYYLAVPAKAGRLLKAVAPELIISVVQLGLIFLSQTPRFRSGSTES